MPSGVFFFDEQHRKWIESGTLFSWCTCPLLLLNSIVFLAEARLKAKLEQDQSHPSQGGGESFVALGSSVHPPSIPLPPRFSLDSPSPSLFDGDSSRAPWPRGERRKSTSIPHATLSVEQSFLMGQKDEIKQLPYTTALPRKPIREIHLSPLAVPNTASQATKPRVVPIVSAPLLHPSGNIRGSAMLGSSIPKSWQSKFV